MGDLIIAEISDTTASLDLSVDREGVGGVTGLTPTVAVRNANTANSYLDFSDSAFKTSGWTTKYQSMTEVERGHYRLTLDIDSLTVSAGDNFIVEYRVNESGIISDAQDRLIVVNSLYDIAGDVWDEATIAHTSAGTFGTEVITSLSASQAAQLLDIYRVLGLDPTTPLIVSKTARSSGAGLSQTIQENVPTSGQVTVTRI